MPANLGSLSVSLTPCKQKAHVRVETESQAKANQILRAHRGVFERVESQFLQRAATPAADFMRKKKKGALRAAGHAQKLLPLADRTPWLFNMDARVMVWRFLSSQETGAFVERNEVGSTDWSLTEDPALTVFVAGLVGGSSCICQSYVAVSRHALGRLHQRGGARTPDDLGRAVLDLHDDIGKISTSGFLGPLSQAAADGKLLFPAKGGAWLMSLIPLKAANDESGPELSLFARSWLSDDDMSEDDEGQVEMLRGELLLSANDADAVASVGGPLFPFSGSISRTHR